MMMILLAGLFGVDISLLNWVVGFLVIVIGYYVVSIWNSGRDLDRKLQAITKVPHRYPFSHLIEMITSAPWDVMEQWTRLYGSILRFHFFSHTFVVVADPEVLKHVLSTNIHNYEKDPSTYAPFMCVLGTGLVTSHGDLWRKQRHLISGVFREEILCDTAKVAINATNRLSVLLDSFRNTSKPVTIGEEFRKLTLQVIGEAVLSLDPEQCDAFFPSVYLPIVEEANKRTWYPWRAFLPTRGNWEYHHAIKQLDQYVTNLVTSRAKLRFEQRSNNNTNTNTTTTTTTDTTSSTSSEQIQQEGDILDRILEACFVEQESESSTSSSFKPTLNEPISQDRTRQLRDEIKTFIFAGHETSSMMITWTLYQLLKNPQCLAKVRAEAEQVFGQYEKSFSTTSPSSSSSPLDQIPFREFAKLSYTQNALREALRLYSVVPVVTRQVVEDDVVGDYFLPRGAKLVLCIQAVHHNEQYWDAPYEFRPERFETNYHPYAFLPFINGPRRCIGQFFALLETKIVLALLVHRFNFSIAPGCVGAKHPFNIPVCPIDSLPVLVQ